MEYSDLDKKLDANWEVLMDENESRFSPEELLKEYIKRNNLPEDLTIDQIPIGTAMEDASCNPIGVYVIIRTAPDLYLKAGDVLFGCFCEYPRSFGLYIVKENDTLLARELAKGEEADVVAAVTEVRRLYE